MMRTASFVTALLSFIVLFQYLAAVPSPRKVVTEEGKTYDESDCESAAKDAANSGACGVIFEKSECSGGFFGTGDAMEITEGNWTGLRGTGFHEDVETILVKPGCVMFGYDEDDKKARGTGISVSAVGKTDWVVRELKSEDFDLKDDIEAVECFCGRQAQEATEFKPLEEKNSFKAFIGWTGAATATKQCNMWIHAFNRLPKSERPCAIIFEEDDCDTDDGVLIKDWYLEVKPKNTVVNLAEVALGASADDAEAVLVRPGCTFTAYDENDGRGKEVTITAPKTSIPTYFQLDEGKYDLKGDMDSYKCVC